MSLPTPHYKLARITGDGRCEEVQIYPLSEPPLEARLDRRGFLQAGLTAAAVLAALRGRAARAASSEEEGDADSISCSDTLAHDVPVGALAVSPDGATLASAGRGGDIKLWTLPLGSLATVLKAGYRSGQALGFTGDSRTLLALHDRSLQRWQLSEEAPERIKGQLAAAGESFLALSADAEAIAVLTPASIEVRSLSGGEPRHVLKRHRGEPAAMLSGDGATLAVDSGRSATVLGDAARAERTMPLGGGAPRRLALDLRGRWLAAGNGRGRVQVWSLAAESPAGLSLQDHGQPVEALAFSADGTLLAAGDRKGVIHLWRLPEGSLIKTLRGKPDAVTALAFNPDASLLISGTRAGVIQLWELPAGTLRSCLVDLEVSPSSSTGNRYEVRTASGRTLSFTAPCGTPLPSGAICTCNCVPGSVAPLEPPASSSGGGSYICTCNKVCVCIPVG